MTDRDALLAAIIAEPADDTARLVYADCLTENGEADRGEFIRVEIELARTPPHTEADENRRKVLFTRRDELFKQHERAWLEPFVPHAKEVSFERGFVHSLAVPAHTFLQCGPRWAAMTPLTRVKFSTCSVWDDTLRGSKRLTGPLFASRLLGRLEGINFETLGLTADDIERFAHCPDLSRLHELILTWNEIRTEGATVLARMPQMQGLVALDLRHNQIMDVGVRAIVESPYLGRLQELRISHNGFKKNSWAMLEQRFGPALVG